MVIVYNIHINSTVALSDSGLSSFGVWSTLPTVVVNDNVMILRSIIVTPNRGRSVFKGVIDTTVYVAPAGPSGWSTNRMAPYSPTGLSCRPRGDNASYTMNHAWKPNQETAASGPGSRVPNERPGKGVPFLALFSSSPVAPV